MPKQYYKVSNIDEALSLLKKTRKEIYLEWFPWGYVIWDNINFFPKVLARQYFATNTLVMED